MATSDSISVGSGSSGETVEEYQWISAGWQEVLVVSFSARRFAGRAAVFAAAVFFYCFCGRLDSILLEDSFPKGVKLFRILVIVVVTVSVPLNISLL